MSDTDSGWSAADKLAGVLALCLLASYQLPGVRTLVASTVDVALGPVEAALPFPVVVAGLAVLTGLASILLREALSFETADAEEMERLREEIETARERDDEEAVQELLDEQFSMMGSQFRGMFKPMVWTMLLTVPVFMWLYWLTVAPNQAIAPVVTVLPVLGDVVWTARVAGPVYAWMVWYFVCSTVANLLLKRTVDRVTAAV
jgi:uncharacterized membrane protein (DUF106 family)